METLAPGNTAPLASFTVPWMLPVPVCAHAVAAKTSSEMSIRRKEQCINPSRAVGLGLGESLALSSPGVNPQREMLQCGMARCASAAVAMVCIALAAVPAIVLRPAQPAGIAFVHRNSPTEQKY